MILFQLCLGIQLVETKAQSWAREEETETELGLVMIWTMRGKDGKQRRYGTKHKKRDKMEEAETWRNQEEWNMSHYDLKFLHDGTNYTQSIT